MVEEKSVPQNLILEILSAIQGALNEENQRVFAKTGRILGARWAQNQPRAANVDDLMEKVAHYLADELRLADSVAFVREGEDYVLKLRGCHICLGELVKERHDIAPACAVSMLPAGAMIKNLGIKNVRLKEIRKPGPAGDCEMVYEIKM
jgi:hypothetical protein